MGADDELDSLYLVPPEVFTAKRTELAKAAKDRGDADAATRISSARKPTTVAWIANRLALQHRNAVQRLASLGDRLQKAHTAMEGDKIRELSVEQRVLLEELADNAFQLAELKTPSATLRDDLTGTLQAAVADADIRGRLGRLTKAERWSGFGGFDFGGWGDGAPSTPAPQAGKPQRQKLRAEVTAAEGVQAEADARLSASQAERDAARQRYDAAAASLREAESALDSAEARYADAKKASQAASESLSQAKARLNRMR